MTGSRRYGAPGRAASKARDARRRHRRLEGAAAVEFALILPLFSILLLGLIDFGHLFFTMNTITNAAREAARQASVQPDQATALATATYAANFYLAAAKLAEGGGGIPKNCTSICPKISPTWTKPGTANESIRVEIKVVGAYKNITGFGYKVMPGFTNPFASMTDLGAVSEMRWELAKNP